jgi:hypothetical protein
MPYCFAKLSQDHPSWAKVHGLWAKSHRDIPGAVVHKPNLLQEHEFIEKKVVNSTLYFRM